MNALQLPSHTDAERNLVGLVLIEGRIPTAAREIATTDFFNRDYAAAWSAFLELDADAGRIDALSAFEVLSRNPSNNLTVAELVATTVGMVNVNESVYVQQIKLAAHKRFLMRELYAQIETISKGGSAELNDLQRKISELDRISQPAGAFKSFADIVEQEIKPALLDLHHGITHRISTGFPSLDRYIGGGISTSDVMVVAALAGAGKSAFVLQLAANIAKQGIPVGFLSGEMSNKENGLRLLSQSAKFTNLNAQTFIHDNELKYLQEWADALKNLPIYFNSQTSDLQTLSRSMRAMVEEKGLRVLVVDYVQLFKVSRYDRTPRFERIAEVSQEIKRIAMEYGIAIIEVAQFNREGAKSLKTSMHDLEGSSQLEKDASLIFILDRAVDSSEVTLRIEKGRNTGKCELKGNYRGMMLSFEF